MITEAQLDPVHSKALPALIVKLLAERQQLLVLFNRLVEMKPYAAGSLVQPLLQQFCQLLVDYVALGHFEVYQGIEDSPGDTEQCRRIRCLAKEVFPRIAETTQAALHFNDRYDSREQNLNFLSLHLSCLGEKLALRIELEDHLIAAIQAL